MPARHPSVRSGVHGAVAPICGRLIQPFGQEVLLGLLNRALARQLSEGEFTFLIDRVLAVSITDLEVRWSFTANAAGNRIVKATEPPDATIRADGVGIVLDRRLQRRQAACRTYEFHRGHVVLQRPVAIASSGRVPAR